MAELRCDFRKALGDDPAILALTPSAVPKSGAESCDVAPLSCGPFVKQDNC